MADGFTPALTSGRLQITFATMVTQSLALNGHIVLRMLHGKIIEELPPVIVSF